MNIAIIASSDAPITAQSSGLKEQYIYTLAEGLYAAGNQITIFAVAGSQLSCRLITFNFDSLDWRFENTKAESESTRAFAERQHAYFEAHKIISQESFDLVHDLSGHHVPVFTAGFLSVPTLTTLYTLPYALLQSSVKLYQGTKNYFVAISHQLQQHWAPYSKINEIVPYAIDPNAWAYSENALQKQAIWKGELVRENQLELVIQACQEQDFKLWIVGPKSNQPFFDYVVEPLLGTQIEYLGDLELEAYQTYLKQASVSIVTRCETDYFASCVIHALAAGTPVAALQDEHIQEFLTDKTGAFAEPDNQKSLEQALVEASNKDRKCCREVAVEYYSKERMITQYSELYRKILNKKPVQSN
ncbi:glycosyltransferase [Croceiramulus getboli]|nr:glycosyltransferase [Flavobacteriaceae bacterium YJPT1-3]